MSEESFADLFQSKNVSRQSLRPGDQLEAVVIGVSGENIFLDIGGKSEGILSASELEGEDGTVSVTPGDRLKVFFLNARNGEMIFTTRLGSGQTSSRELEEAFQAGIPIEGKVTEEIKGGFAVTMAGQRAFCPYSQMDIRKVENAEEYLEKDFVFRIIEFNNQGRNIIVSARAILEQQRAEQKENLKKSLDIGIQVTGTVTSIRDFGAFVDIGGVDGLIPISELAWGQTSRVEDVLSRGQEVQVVVKNLDWDRDRISLSLKETTPNPWDQVLNKYPVGSIHTGQVAKLANFGAFVNLEPGIDGLLHISKIAAGKRIHHPREVLEEGQDLTVRIEAIDIEKQRLSLTPEDYKAPEKEKAGKFEVPTLPKESASMGTFGDLLKSQLKKKQQ